jgi:BMFP domain-containing protein YqiC
MRMGGTGEGKGGREGKRGLFDDLAGMASGAVSIVAGARTEAEAMMRAQVEAMVQKLDLVKREELDAALEVARRAREQAEALELRLAALEARLSEAPPPTT